MTDLMLDAYAEKAMAGDLEIMRLLTKYSTAQKRAWAKQHMTSGAIPGMGTPSASTGGYNIVGTL